MKQVCPGEFTSALVDYQGVAPGFIRWEIATNLKKKTVNIQNGDIFEHREIFSSICKKIVKLQQHSELK